MCRNVCKRVCIDHLHDQSRTVLCSQKLNISLNYGDFNANYGDFNECNVSINNLHANFNESLMTVKGA